MQLLDRETRREKVIEAKNREIRLKMKTTKVDVDSERSGASKEPADNSKSDLSQDPIFIQCEQDYNAVIETVSLFISTYPAIYANNFIDFLYYI